MTTSPPQNRTTILSAPAGWGKTVNAERLLKEFSCSVVVDEWSPGQRITPNALHLTNVPDVPPALALHAKVVLRGW